jgi:hypothetical protein
MANYCICPVCTEPIEVEKYEAHRKTHREPDYETDTSKLKQILDESKNSCKKKNDNSPISLFFVIAKRVLSEIEKIDTSGWTYLFDNNIPEIMQNVQPGVPSPYPPIMCHIKFKVKDKAKFEQLLKKHRGTEVEQVLKSMVSTNMPLVVVYKREWARHVLEMKAEGKPSTDIMILDVYFFLHEMYHILGFGEKDSTTKASIAMYKIFGQKVGIPEHEIDRWKYEEEHNKKTKEK